MVEQRINYDIFPCNIPCFCEEKHNNCKKCSKRVLWKIVDTQKFACGHKHECKGKVSLTKPEAIVFCKYLKNREPSKMLNEVRDSGDDIEIEKDSSIKIFPCQTFCICLKRKDSCERCLEKINLKIVKKEVQKCGHEHEIRGSIELEEDELKNFCSYGKTGTIRQKEKRSKSSKCI